MKKKIYRERYNMINGLGEVIATVDLKDIKLKEDANAKTVKIKGIRKTKKVDK